MREIKSQYTIVIVTHNMQQATRVSDRTAFYSVLRDEKSDTRTGVLVEYGRTAADLRGSARQPHQGLRHRPDGLSQGGDVPARPVKGLVSQECASIEAITVAALPLSVYGSESGLSRRRATSCGGQPAGAEPGGAGQSQCLLERRYRGVVVRGHVPGGRESATSRVVACGWSPHMSSTRRRWG